MFGFGEVLVLGASVVGCVSCWTAAQKHRLTTELQKHKLNHDLEVLRPVEPKMPLPPKKGTDAATAGPDRVAETTGRPRGKHHLTSGAIVYVQSVQRGKQYEQLRTDALRALEDAREEQAELIIDLEKLLNSMRGELDEEGTHASLELDAAKKPVQLDSGGLVAQRVADPCELHDAELHEQETSRKGAA